VPELGLSSAAQRRPFKYDIYSGEMFERSCSAQVAFLRRTLRVGTPIV